MSNNFNLPNSTRSNPFTEEGILHFKAQLYNPPSPSWQEGQFGAGSKTTRSKAISKINDAYSDGGIKNGKQLKTQIVQDSIKSKTSLISTTPGTMKETATQSHLTSADKKSHRAQKISFAQVSQQLASILNDDYKKLQKHDRSVSRNVQGLYDIKNNTMKNERYHKFSKTMMIVVKEDAQHQKAASALKSMKQIAQKSPSKNSKIFKSDNPGPGQYEPRVTLSKERVKTTVIKGSERFKQPFKDESLGPGLYYREEYFARNASPITLKGKLNDISQDRKGSPGPGCYDPVLSAVQLAVKSIKLSSSQRPIDGITQHNRMDSSPGPAAYNHLNRNIGRDAAQFSMRGRSNSYRLDDKPGPGSYQIIDSAVRNPSIKMVRPMTGNPLNKKSDLPGPGAYQYSNKAIGTDGPKFTLKSKAQQKNHNEDSPGPGHYEANNSCVKEKSPSFGLKGRHVVNNRSLLDMPDMCTYDPVKSIGMNAPKISMHGRPTSKINNDSPGPATYNAALTLVKDSVKTSSMIKTSARSPVYDASKLYMPGPGQYDQHSRIGRDSPGITLKSRIQMPISQKEQSPGPGEYDPQEKLTRPTLKSYKYHDLYQDAESSKLIRQQDVVPGPGTYDIITPTGKHAPSMSLKGRIETNRGEDSPGPGSYDNSQSYKAARERSPSFKLGKQSREYQVPRCKQDIPGPGEYYPKLNNGAVAFSLGGKTLLRMPDDLPGPSHYQVPTPNATRFKNHSSDFSKSPERRLLPKSTLDLNLGPGQYDIPNIKASGHHQLLAYSFAKGVSRDQQVKNSPGPGTYDLPKTFGIHLSKKR